MAPALNPSSITGGALLPPDAVYEILLRLPAKTLCRLRAVCRSWRSLTTDPHFITAHEARNRQEPLLLVADAGGDIQSMDMAGDMVRRVCSSANKALAAGPRPREHAGPICLVRTPTTSVCVLDAAAGTVTASLPVDGFDYGTTVRRRWRASGYEAFYALGKAATTGEHKVLRVLRPTMSSRLEHRCDVFTLDDLREWRPRPSPPAGVLPSGTAGATIHDAVIGGIAYFLSDYLTPNNAHEPDCIWSFDLDTEEWSPAPALRGPLSTHGLLHDTTDDDDDDDYYPDDEHGTARYIDLRCELRLTQANGRLVTIRNQCRRAHDASLDLWFLADMDKGLWVKQYTIPIMAGPRRPEVEEDRARPLLLLDDGRVVWSAIESRPRDGAGAAMSLCHHEEDAVETVVVRVYDPRGDACSSTEVVRVEGGHVVGVCTGVGGSSLLRLRESVR